MDPHLVSIIIPNLNYARFLPDCIQSVLNQTYGAWEIVFSDDFSLDDSVFRVKQFRDRRIRVVESPFSGPSGPGATRNRGIEASRGEFLAFLDSDDMLTPDSLERRLDALGSNDLVCGQATLVGPECGLREALEAPSGDSTHRRFQASTILVRRGLLERKGGFNPDLLHREDKELWLRLQSGDDPAKVLILDDILAFYRVHAGSITAQWRGYDRATKRRFNQQFREAQEKT